MLIVATCALVLGIGWQDREPAAPRQRPRAAVQAGPLVFPRSVGIDCKRAGVGDFVCAVSGVAVASPSKARPAVVIPPVWPNGYLSLSVRNKRFDGDTLSVEIGVVNLLGQPMGTLDGTTALGMKVFLWEPPQLLNGSGAVTMVGAEGSEAFRTDTTGVEPYLTYAGMVAPQDTSAERTWRFLMPPGASSMHFALGVSAAVPAETNVTLAPPDTIPEWVHADSNIADVTSIVGGPFTRQVLIVTFRNDASLADRQLAVALVGGQVVGGVAGEGGYYVVRISDPDRSGKQLFAARRRLAQLPQVRNVRMEVYLSPLYLRPNDGAAWQNWRLTPDKADTLSRRWALEMIDAPMAWGCSTGDSTLRIGVIDHGFRRPPDLATNLPNTGSYVFSDPDTTLHATEVTSVLAARGDNGSGMTGVLWRATLDVEDPRLPRGAPSKLRKGFDPWDLGTAIARLGARGARVINISIGNEWSDSVTRQFRAPRADSSDTAKTLDALNGVVLGLRWARSNGYSGPVPLLVIGAGNFQHPGANANTDSWWSALPQLRDSLGDTVLVVGASTKQKAVAWFSGVNVNHSYVEIMAPGQSVAALNDSGTVDTLSGTSFAAPHVTGVAGMVLAFDPSILGGAPELKRLILAGADSNRGPGGQPRKVGCYRLLNAYETLRQAARRSGAPLCGNRVWAVNGAIVAERTGNATQTLASGLGTLSGQLQPMHGGQKIFFADSDSGWSSLAWNAQGGSWTVQYGQLGTYLDSFPLSAYSAQNLYGGASHDADSFVVAVGGGGAADIGIAALSDPTNLTQLATFLVPDSLSAIPAFAAQYGAVYVAVNEATGSSKVYRIPTTPGSTPALLSTLTGRIVFQMSEAEDASQFALLTGTNRQGANCQVEYRDTTFTTLLRPTQVSLSAAACVSTLSFFGGFGTMAPLRAGNRGSRRGDPWRWAGRRRP
jgi:hypothetical protein